MNITNQEIFDQVCRHLANQKCRSMKGVFCQYRGIQNTKCAVGIFISDEEYDPDWDECGISVKSFMEDYGNVDRPAILRDASEDRIRLLDQLQSAHDNGEFDVMKLSSALTVIAGNFSLDPKNISLITEWIVPHED